MLVLVLSAATASGLARHSTWARARAPQSTWAAPGSGPLSDARAAALITSQPENRPANAPANEYVPTEPQLRKFYSARNNHGETTVQWNPLYRFVTGRSRLVHASTDDLIQWVAHKWGIPEDVIRAQMMRESGWNMSQLGDRRTVRATWYSQYPRQARLARTSDVFSSMGIAQVKWVPDGSIGAGSEPLRWRSTAFNLDFFAATVRYYYDGHCGWCGSGYHAGQSWNSVGAWYSPLPWGGPQARLYIYQVQRIIRQKSWQ
jgi:hypothetical protein